MPNDPFRNMYSRRHFLQTGAATAALCAMPTSGRGDGHQSMAPGLPDYTARDPRIKEIALQAIAAAQRGGASYADVRITLQRMRGFDDRSYTERVVHGIGVRARCDGYWGFASAPNLSSAEAVRVGQDAAQLSRANRENRPSRPIQWTPIPVVERGDWSTPIEIDPFEVDIGEILDWSAAMSSYYTRVMQHKHPSRTIEILGVKVGASNIQRTDEVFVSTEGSYIVQTFHTIDPSIGLSYRVNDPALNLNGLPDSCMYFMTDQVMSGLWPTAGWEVALQFPVEAAVDRTIAAIEEDIQLPVRSVDVGRYDVVYDWNTMGRFVSATLGRATELDRALGDEANAGGTSYLGPLPSDFLGTRVAAPMVTLTANRSTPGAANTVRWDAEGVKPSEFTIVQEGKLVNYQTTRESAGWLSGDGNSATRAAYSYGCSGVQGSVALNLPLQHQPNLVLAPAQDKASLDSLVSSMTKGLLICQGNVDTDFQALNGYGAGRTYEIRNGKKVARVMNSGVLFRSLEFWRSVTALGGVGSSRWSREFSIKGEPGQFVVCSISAPPALVKDVTVIDRTRRV